MKFEKGLRAFFVGIKGTGMCALAELMHSDGLLVSGSDTAEVFYTDAILRDLGIPCAETFTPEALPSETGLVIHSAAYSPETNPQLVLARERGLPIHTYPEALGAYSAHFDSSGIAGVHGKTTTTAMTGELLRAAGLPARVLAGSASGGFGGRSTLILGDKYFVAETCEYRRHFLSFHPRRIVLTAVESDHQDYYPTYQSIRNAFVEYCRKLPPGGELIYCADDPGASEVADIIRAGGQDLRFQPYGFTAAGAFKIEDYRVDRERIHFRLPGFLPAGDRGSMGNHDEFRLRAPGRHNALNAAAAAALCSALAREENGAGLSIEQMGKVRLALEEFRGTKRRSEITGEAGGVLFMDDYGHHPTAIKTTLAGLREFYPDRRLVLSFMSHTYSRTAALLDEFAGSFGDADILFLHKIYASARERSGALTGETLFEKTRALSGPALLYYVEEPLNAVEPLKKLLRPGDLFLTMGAGDNWKLGKALLDFFQKNEE